jgi:hypothetical protein
MLSFEGAGERISAITSAKPNTTEAVLPTHAALAVTLLII